MPKSTFYNLSDEKKGRIFDAIVQEFSTRRFSEASINQIIKNAGIPKGSFYQYFTDKEDLYLYVTSEISKEKRNLIHQAQAQDPDADFFKALRQNIEAVMELGKIKPEYGRIFMLMEMDDSEFIRTLRADAIKGWREIIEKDKECGLIKPEINTDVVLDLFYTFTLLEYYRIGLNEKAYFMRLDEAIKIMKKGIARD